MMNICPDANDCLYLIKSKCPHSILHAPVISCTRFSKLCPKCIAICNDGYVESLVSEEYLKKEDLSSIPLGEDSNFIEPIIDIPSKELIDKFNSKFKS
jgi:hypothetical protein